MIIRQRRLHLPTAEMDHGAAVQIACRVGRQLYRLVAIRERGIKVTIVQRLIPAPRIAQFGRAAPLFQRAIKQRHGIFMPVAHLHDI